MREHLYKAKQTDNNEWVEGSLRTTFLQMDTASIFVDKIDRIEEVFVDPNTVCEFTGLCDKNGKKIFEGDVVAPKYITPVGKLTEDLDYDRKGVIELVAGSYVIKRPNHNQMALYSLVELEDMGYVSNVGNVYRPKNNICFVEVIGNKFDNPEILNRE